MIQIFSLSSKTRALVSMIFLCLILWVIRIRLTGETTGIFLAWNLFLAFTPLFLILMARKLFLIYETKTIVSKIRIYSLMFLWLLFFPNSPYIITDLIHLKHLPKEMLWFDSIAIFLTAMTGLIVGLYSVEIFRVLTKRIFGKAVSLIFTLGALVLSAFGVYLGRNIRLNSWDFLTHPTEILKTAFGEVYEPMAIKMTIVFSMVLIGIYYSYNQFMSNYASQENDPEF